MVVTGDPLELLPTTRRRLDHRLARAQAEGRAPSMAAGLVRDGALVWSGGRGSVGGAPPTTDTQYRIGSITKTFVAVLVLRLRDEGRLDLADPLEAHLPGTAAGDRTLLQLLSHTAGVASETPPPWWERTDGAVRPAVTDLLGDQPAEHAHRADASTTPTRGSRCWGRWSPGSTAGPSARCCGPRSWTRSACGGRP